MTATRVANRYSSEIIVSGRIALEAKKTELLSAIQKNSIAEKLDGIDQDQKIAVIELCSVEIVRDHEELRNIERALHKCDNETYGVCEGCGKLIPELRMKAIPEAHLCVSCCAKNNSFKKSR
ncbi:MAG: TraR/DksA C4-type zinc finger protein [Candidatus Nealsonbacteria bacterium]